MVTEDRMIRVLCGSWIFYMKEHDLPDREIMEDTIKEAMRRLGVEDYHLVDQVVAELWEARFPSRWKF